MGMDSTSLSHFNPFMCDGGSHNVKSCDDGRLARGAGVGHWKHLHVRRLGRDGRLLLTRHNNSTRILCKRQSSAVHGEHCSLHTSRAREQIKTITYDTVVDGGRFVA